MPLGRFLAAAYALLVEEYRKLGMDLITAIARVNEAIGLTDTKETPQAAVVERTPTASDNDRALAELQQMMGSSGWASS